MINLEHIPESEVYIYETMKELNKEEKLLLWYLIKNCNKDGMAIYPKLNAEIETLVSKKLIILNNLYNMSGKNEGINLSEFCFHILPKAPTLLKAMKRRANKKTVLTVE